MSAFVPLPPRGPRSTRVTDQGTTLWIEGRPLAQRDRWERDNDRRWLVASAWATMLVGPVAVVLLAVLLVLTK